MMQLTLSLGYRLECGPARWSWRDGDRVIVRWFGPHCIDTAWPWFRYGPPD